MSRNRLISSLINKDTNLVKNNRLDSDLIVSSAIKSSTASSAGATVYSSLANLPDSVSSSTGQQAFVTSNNGLYIFNGSGWYKVATINATPYWISQPNSTYALNTNGTATVITINAGDSDNQSINFTATVDSGFNSIATVTRDSDNGRIFVVRSIDSDNSASQTNGSGTITFKASDGLSFASQISTFSINFVVVLGKWSARDSGYSGSGTSLPNLGYASSADGTLQSGVSYDSTNEWFSFDGGSNAFVQYPNENGQYPDSDFTIYAVVNINSYGNSNEWDSILENRLLHLNGANSSVTSRRGGITSSIENGYPEFYYCDTNQAYNVLRSTTRINLDQWYFLAFTREKSSGTMKTFVNNTSTETDSTTKSTLSVKHDNFGYEISTGITFGKRIIATFPNTYGFKGKAIEWGIYDYVLSSSELNTIKNQYSSLY